MGVLSSEMTLHQVCIRRGVKASVEIDKAFSELIALYVS